MALKQSKLDVSASGGRNATDTPVCLSHQKGFVGDMEFDGWANNGDGPARWDTRNLIRWILTSKSAGPPSKHSWTKWTRLGMRVAFHCCDLSSSALGALETDLLREIWLLEGSWPVSDPIRLDEIDKMSARHGALIRLIRLVGDLCSLMDTKSQGNFCLLRYV